jgi:hypothetical protein
MSHPSDNTLPADLTLVHSATGHVVSTGRIESQVRRAARDYRRTLGSLSALHLVARPESGETAIIEGDHLSAWADARRTWYR